MNTVQTVARAHDFRARTKGNMTELGIDGISQATAYTSGGSSVIYEAWQKDFDRRVAVKVLRGPAGEETQRRFQRERHAAGRLSGHPGIVDIYSGGVTDAGELYLVMPFIEGGSLQNELVRSGRFSLKNAVTDVVAIAEAVEFAHRQGVIHRDLKPANILRDSAGRPLVTDFGIARLIDGEVASATVAATTPLYAAPEILANGTASPASDVYSLGAMLYALLAGRPAFSEGNAENIWTVLERIRSNDPEPIDGVPLQVMDVIRVAMSKTPINRPTSAGLFAQYLRFAIDEATRGANSASSARGQHFATSESIDLRDDSNEWVNARTTMVSDTPQSPVRPATIGTGPSTPSRPGSWQQPAAAYRQHPNDHHGQHHPTRGHEGHMGARSDDGIPSRWMVAAAAALAVIMLAGVGVYQFVRSSTSPGDRLEVAAEQSFEPVVAPTATPEPTSEPTAVPESIPVTAIPATATAVPTATPEPTPVPDFSNTIFAVSFDTDDWELRRDTRDVGYGFRTDFRDEATGNFVYIDATPADRATPGASIEQSAHWVHRNIASASPVINERIGDKEAWTFEFIGNDGSKRIDIFFELDGTGYAVVGGSHTGDSEAAFASARALVASLSTATPSSQL